MAIPIKFCYCKGWAHPYETIRLLITLKLKPIYLTSELLVPLIIATIKFTIGWSGIAELTHPTEDGYAYIKALNSWTLFDSSQ